MFLAVIIAVAMVLATFALHFQCISLLQRALPRRFSGHDNWLVLLVVFALFWVHMAEIGAYAAVYYIAENHLAIGSFLGESVDGFMMYFYYSGVVYTSLGFGDIFPEGHVRFISQVEALNGLMLITWSASFTYLVMRRAWEHD